MRTPIIAGNWKMNKAIAEAHELVTAMQNDLVQIANRGVEIVLCPPFVSIPEVFSLLKGTPIRTGAQNLFWEPKGAFTGEVSGPMLHGLCDYVIVGHSERRQYFGETDEGVNRKIKAAFSQELFPIVCVGESLAQYEAGQTASFVGGQVRAAFQGLSDADARRTVVAYEPIWAIGTGRASSGPGANTVIGESIRGVLAGLYGKETADAIRVQYGGSVNPKNIAEFLGQPEIDGALVGGASLVASDFIAICRAAAIKT